MLDFSFMLTGAACLGAVISFILILLGKWLILDWYVYQSSRRRWIPKPCNFCFAFWASILFCWLYAGVIGFDLNIIFWPFIAPPLMLFLLRSK